MDEKRKIKAMHLIWSMGDGGAQQVVINYLRDFEDDEDIDLRVYVYNAPTSSKYDQEIADNNYPVTYLNNPKSRIKIPVVRYPFNKLVARRTWYQTIKEYAPDIVHVHISGLLDDVLIPIVKAGVKVRFDTLHSHPLRYQGHELNVIKKAFNKYEFIPICVTKEQAEVAKSYYGFKSYELVRNGIDINKLVNCAVDKKTARKQLGIKEGTFVALGIGRLDAVKRFDLLIQAFANIVKKREDSILLLAGEGSEKERLLALAKELDILDKVRFLGFVDEPSLLYSASNILGVTSSSESASLVLIEAQAIGLRAVISDGVPDESIVTDKVQKMSQDATCEQWAEALLNEEFVGNIVCDIMDYDVHKSSQKLKEIYLKYST